MNVWEEALSLLPESAREAVRIAGARESVSEIRLRRDLPLSVTVPRGNLMLSRSGRAASPDAALRLSGEEITRALLLLCEGSVYRHIDTLGRGYLVTPRGLRVGVSGEIVRADGGSFKADLAGVTGLSLRIPHAVEGAADALLSRFRREGLCSVLIYSPPGGGKTTLLRELAIRLSAGALGRFFRVTVIDERGELFPPLADFTARAGLLEVLSGLPKAEGIERATRLLSPEVIVTDELGACDAPEGLLSAHSGGVTLALSVHALSVEELYGKPYLASLLHSGVFGLLCGVSWNDPDPEKRILLRGLSA